MKQYLFISILSVCLFGFALKKSRPNSPVNGFSYMDGISCGAEVIIVQQKGPDFKNKMWVEYSWITTVV